MKNGAIGRAVKNLRQFSRPRSRTLRESIDVPTGALNFLPKRDIVGLLFQAKMKMCDVVSTL